LIKWPQSMEGSLSPTRGHDSAAMSGITKAFNAIKTCDGDSKRSAVGISIRRFCESLARRLSRETRAQDEVALSSASVQTDSPMQLPINRIIKDGKFDWGSFSAFEDGSFEVEIAGVKQWFKNFSELERGLRSRGRG
jgi:hypothetical protein